MIGFRRLLRDTALNSAVTNPSRPFPSPTSLRGNAAQRLLRLLVLLAGKHVAHLGNLLQLHFVFPRQSQGFSPLLHFLLPLLLRLRQDGIGLGINSAPRTHRRLCFGGQNFVQRVREVRVVGFLDYFVISLYAQSATQARLPTFLLLSQVVLLQVSLVELIILNRIAQIARIEGL